MTDAPPGSAADLPDELRPLVEVLVGRLEMTPPEVASDAGVTLDETRRLWRALGFPPVPDDARAFSRADAAILGVVRRVAERAALDPPVLLQLARVTGRALDRIADAQVAATGPALVAAGGDPAGALAVVAADLERLLGWVWRRHLLAALLRRAARPSAGERAVVVAFADMVGFTRLGQALDPHDLAAMVDRFEAIAYEEIPGRGGRVIKMIGDEVMFAADDPAAAAAMALGLVDAHARADGLPAVRVGLALGPALEWEGDLFGATVNLASRLVNIARPSTVLVSDAFGQALADVPGLALRHLRPLRLEGIGRVRSWVVRRAGRSAG